MATLNGEFSRAHVPEVRGTWVQTERKGLELLAELNRENPRAAGLMLTLIANMDNTGGVVVSQDVLATFCGCSPSTVKRALRVLVKGNWIETASIGMGRGATLAYFINSRVAWADKRENLKYAYMNARIILSEAENPDLGKSMEPLKQIQRFLPNEEVLPHGDGLNPPAQDEFDETLHRLPTVNTEHEERIKAAGIKAGAIFSKSQERE